MNSKARSAAAAQELVEQAVFAPIFGQPARAALVADDSRVVFHLVGEHFLLKEAEEGEQFFLEAALLDHEEHEIDAVVDLGERALEELERVARVRVWITEAHGVDDAQVGVAGQRRVARASVGAVACLEGRVLCGVQARPLVDETVAQRRLAHAARTDENDRLVQLRRCSHVASMECAQHANNEEWQRSKDGCLHCSKTTTLTKMI